MHVVKRVQQGFGERWKPSRAFSVLPHNLAHGRKASLRDDVLGAIVSKSVVDMNGVRRADQKRCAKFGSCAPLHFHTASHGLQDLRHEIMTPIVGTRVDLPEVTFGEGPPDLISYTCGGANNPITGARKLNGRLVGRWRKGLWHRDDLGLNLADGLAASKPCPDLSTGHKPAVVNEPRVREPARRRKPPACSSQGPAKALGKLTLAWFARFPLSKVFADGVPLLQHIFDASNYQSPSCIQEISIADIHGPFQDGRRY